MSYFKCSDGDNPNNFLVIEDGRIGVFKDIGGQPTLFTPLTRMTVFEAKSGVPVEIPEYFESPPKVYVYPKKMKTYSSGHRGCIQRVEISTPAITSLGSGRYRVLVSGELDVLSGSSVFYPLDIRDTRLEENTLEFGPYFVPNAAKVSATLYGSFWENTGYSGYKQYFNRKRISMSIGLSDTQDGTVTWGPSSSTTIASTNMFSLNASISGSGNWSRIKINKSNDGSWEWTVYWISPWSCQLFQIPGMVVDVSGGVVDNTAIFTCIAVGS